MDRLSSVVFFFFKQKTAYEIFFASSGTTTIPCPRSNVRVRSTEQRSHNQKRSNRRVIRLRLSAGFPSAAAIQSSVSTRKSLPALRERKMLAQAGLVHL